MRKISVLIVNMVLFCATVSAQSPAGFALSLDGDADYADFGNAIETNFGTSDFTIEFWMNKHNERIEAVIGKREYCYDHSFWNSRIHSASNIEIDQDMTGDNHYGISGREYVADTVWHHIAITRQDSILKLYLDAVLDTMGASDSTIHISNTASLLIGDNPCVGLDGTNYFSGMIDEVRIWNTARTAAQLQSNMGDTLGAEYYSSADSGLIGYWRFDELEDLGINGDGVDDVRDFSISGNHGDLVGDAVLVASGALVNLEDDQGQLSRSFMLSQNFPNPFNPATSIQYELPKAARVSLKVYNMLGQEVRALVNEKQLAGENSVVWDGRDHSGMRVSSGIYIYRLRAGEYVQSRKMILVR